MKINTITSLVFMLITMSWGCSQDTAKETESKKPEATQQKKAAPAPEKNVEAPLETEAASGTDATGLPDTYGRKPGDEHYGHSHGPEGDNPAAQPSTGAPFAKDAPAPSGPDKFGRQPGEQHYGHDHE